MGIIEEASRYSENLKLEIADLEKQLESAPAGSIRINKSKSHFKWFVRNDDGSRSYIPKQQKDFATELALKSYNKSKLCELIQKQSTIDDFIQKMNRIKELSDIKIFESKELGRLISNGLLEKRTDIPSELIKWAESDYPRSTKNPEHLNVKVRDDLYVRSKSEAFIAMELIKAGIPFRYECELVMDDVAFYPDFTIMNPRTGELVIWEHFGLIDNPDYRRKMISKLDTYMKNDFIPATNLIITCESLSKPIDFENIRNIVKLYFC